MKSLLLLAGLFAMMMTSCNENNPEASNRIDTTIIHEAKDTEQFQPPKNAEIEKVYNEGSPIDTKNIHPAVVVSFAQTLIGVPYKYASTDPSAGFDCSGFITYVFNHFNIAVPRSSIDFTNKGKEVQEPDAKKGDLILFTGTNPAERSVGHMGLIIENKPEVQFIHSSSGKANGVTITPLNNYYRTRFVKIIRIFKENDQ